MKIRKTFWNTMLNTPILGGNDFPMLRPFGFCFFQSLLKVHRCNLSISKREWNAFDHSVTIPLDRSNSLQENWFTFLSSKHSHQALLEQRYLLRDLFIDRRTGNTVFTWHNQAVTRCDATSGGQRKIGVLPERQDKMLEDLLAAHTIPALCQLLVELRAALNGTTPFALMLPLRTPLALQMPGNLLGVHVLGANRCLVVSVASDAQRQLSVVVLHSLGARSGHQRVQIHIVVGEASPQTAVRFHLCTTAAASELARLAICGRSRRNPSPLRQHVGLRGDRRERDLWRAGAGAGAGIIASTTTTAAVLTERRLTLGIQSLVGDQVTHQLGLERTSTQTVQLVSGALYHRQWRRTRYGCACLHLSGRAYCMCRCGGSSLRSSVGGSTGGAAL
mmetsp:Transcript_24008/g.60053  ORF Transcript_24008/g.60053 Transcript_24008/m.60053 type:complete len:390 (+) Transcript_24008:1505-2674(+)